MAVGQIASTRPEFEAIWRRCLQRSQRYDPLSSPYFRGLTSFVTQTSSCTHEKKSRDVLGLFDLLVAFQRFEINHFVRLLTRQKIEKCNFEKSSSIVNVYLNSYLRVKTVCVRQVHHLLSSHSRRSVRNNSLIQKIASQLRRQKFKQLQGDCQKDSRLGKVNKT